MRLTDIYYMSFPADNRKIKSLVGTIYIVEIAQLSMYTVDTYRIFARGRGDILELINTGLDYLNITGCCTASEFCFIA